eukprot:CAMPEP_0203844332 /NCGR_PEP_ID=MMETSP0359-20131031/3133_1 /ASSEMBLY_ACC=CAM_ASM_000338 /TAXON_ID=268821 /ORGANISM="Scrippsiella Hangoei, Strain SHTV-5" /LENGTH=818 /DNA_ID=CAMNT_0050759247 /DNA_START=47 /DNA_END=2500 /DNA_ORIENTATION=-
MADPSRRRAQLSDSRSLSEESSLLREVTVSETVNQESSRCSDFEEDEPLYRDKRHALLELEGGSIKSGQGRLLEELSAKWCCCSRFGNCSDSGYTPTFGKWHHVSTVAIACLCAVLIMITGVATACFSQLPGGSAGHASEDAALVVKTPPHKARPQRLAAVTATTALAAQCDEESWPGKGRTCAACTVQVSNFGGNGESSAATSGTCHSYCLTIGRSCSAAWSATRQGICWPIFESSVTCQDLLPNDFAICQCGHTDQHHNEQQNDADTRLPTRSSKADFSRADEHAKEQIADSDLRGSDIFAPLIQHPKEHHQDQPLDDAKRIPEQTSNSSRQNHSQSVQEASEDPFGPGSVKSDGDAQSAACSSFEEGVDYWTSALLSIIVEVQDRDACNAHCLELPKCGAWTWGKGQNVVGLTNVCFLKKVDDKATVIKHANSNVDSGFRSKNELCKSSEDKASAQPVHALGSASTSLAEVVKNRQGQCLDASDVSQTGIRVQMWTCIAGSPNQEWTFTNRTGQVKNQGGRCLSAPQRTTELSSLVMSECDPADWDQQWDYFRDTGLMKNWRGICVDAAEANVDGGQVYMRGCHQENMNQQWLLGPLSSMPKPSADGVRLGNSLYCFVLILPGSYEQQLLATQSRQRVGIFLCDEYTVYSNKPIDDLLGVPVGIVNSSLKCEKGGEFGTALNLDIFMSVWDAVRDNGKFLHQDWTVKVDPDSVFFPDRLRSLIGTDVFEPPSGVYLNNCMFGLHGPLEVLSKRAVESWLEGRYKCKDHFWEMCHGDCLWGEDLFVDQCLWKVLNVRREGNFRLLMEEHCKPPDNW